MNDRPLIPQTGSVLGIDWGQKRVGLATCDAQGLATTPHKVFMRNIDSQNKNFWIPSQDDLMFLEKIINEYECQTIILGQPLALGGQSTEGSEGALRLKEILSLEFKLEVFLVDESLTSWEVKEVKKTLPKSQRDFFDRNKDSYVAANLLKIFFRNPPTCPSQ
jgi:putative Holliday junction resolvase